MPIDTSIYGNIQPVKLDNPMTSYANALALQGEQQKNSLFPLQAQQMQLGLVKSQQQNQLLQQLFSNDGSGQPAQSGQSSVPGQSGTQMQLDSSGNVVGQTSGTPSKGGINLNVLNKLAATGFDTKSLFDQYKYGMDGVKRDAGAYYKDPATGEVKYYADPKTGLNINPTTNQVTTLPGAAASQAQLAGATSAATEGAKLLPLGYVGQNGRPVGGTVGQYLGDQSGQQAAPQGQPGGFVPSPVALSGDPVPPQALAILTQVANSRDPSQLQNLVANMTAGINQMPDPQKRATALANVQDEVQKIQQYWQQSQQPSQQSGSPPVLQSASEAAQAAADVQAKNAPELAYATDAAKALQAKGEHVGAQLSESQGLLQRIQESRDALTKFQAGGGMDTRVEMAKLAQSIPGMPKSVVDGIAGGSLSAAQEFQKYAAQEALQTMQQALASDTGKGAQGNRISMQLFIKNNPNIDTDPNAIEKIFNFQTKLHNELLNKSDQLTKFISDPNTVKDPSVFDNQYAHSQINSGNVQPKMTQGQAKGTAPAPPAAGGTIRVTNAADYGRVPSGSTYMAPDGTMRRKP
jgi:hypothetical protein